MKLLLDTHVFLWWVLTPERLPAPVLKAWYIRPNIGSVGILVIGILNPCKKPLTQ